MKKMTQIAALTEVIEVIENNNLVSDEVINKLKDIKIALEKKNGKTSSKVSTAKAEKYENVKKFFVEEPMTLTEILKVNRNELDEMGISSSQGLLGAIRAGLENGEIIREKSGKTTTFRLAD